MFTLFALLFLMLPQGGYSDKPAATLPYRNPFPTEDACMNFFDTEAGQLAKQELDAMLAADDEHKYKVEFKCLPVTVKEDAQP